MSGKQKFYVVWEGRRPGVYSTWKEAQQQVLHFEGARFKAFDSRLLAEEAFKTKPQSFYGKKDEGAAKTYNGPAICVDAACSGNPGTMEYRAVDFQSRKVLFHQGPFAEATNNIGEFLAIVHALAMLYKQADKHTVIYSDSVTAISWVRKKKCNSKLVLTDKNKEVFQLISRAESWLQTHSFSNPILKWDTERKGEIPADFGRK